MSIGQAPCETGHYCTAGTQERCAIGTYQDERGQTSCKACAAPYFGNDTGLVVATCSGVCPPRHECIEGKLSDECDDSLIVSERARCTSCKANEFAFHSKLYPRFAHEIVGNDSCIECPHTPHDEAKCNGGLLEFSPGFWHSGVEWADRTAQNKLEHRTKESLGWTPPGAAGGGGAKLAFYPCPCKQCCDVDARTGAVTCTPGNMGVLCAVCAPEYYKRSDTGECVACEDANAVQDVPWIPMLVFTCFLLFFIGSDARCEWRRFRFLQRHIQGCRRLLVGKSKIVLSFFSRASIRTIYFVCIDFHHSTTATGMDDFHKS